MPFNKAMSFVIRQRPDFHSLSSGEVLDEFIAMDIMNKTVDNALARVRSKTTSPNLALNTKAIVDEEEEEEDGCPEGTKYAYHEHMALASNCPYEKREDNGGKLIRKDRPKSFPSKNTFTKKTHPRGLVAHEEYTSDDDEDDTCREGMSTATVDIATSSPKVSLFGATNENRIAKCLMAKGINKVTPSIKTTLTTSPSLLDDVDNSKVAKLDENEFDKFLCNIKGETKRHFVALLEQLGEANDLVETHEDTISKMQEHSRDYTDEIAELFIALEEECGLRLALEESLNVDHAKLQKDLDHASVLTRVLKTKKVALGVGHDRLKKDFDILDEAHKVLKSAHFSLKESHDQLQAKLTKEISTCPPFVLIDNASATNSCCEHVHLMEENAKLKEQLKKGLVTCIQGEKNLNDLLSNQKEVAGTKGLGFATKSKKKKKNKTKPSPSLKDIFVQEGESTHKKMKNKEGGDNVKKGKTTPTNTAGDFNSSYILCRASDGHVYAKFVGSYYEYI
ncbi:hypothetical protein ZWY2020_013027 [Hordeum vulgare]|nr:hypothetical protein ZWY2020_013027 [Hordeum vulgare]